jgi:protein-L-isoaspartate(D-aspartate) O-methyltransferase
MATMRHNPAVERAVRAVRREFFLPTEQRGHAQEDTPLPIGWGQTISQPSLVTYMTQQLALTPHSRVLEIGTGSGFQTAILAEIATEVYTIERVPELASVARRRLEELHYRNVHFRVGDGALGWPEAAPFDRIMVTAAARTLPPALLDQLAPEGRLVAPIGPTSEEQLLVLVERDVAGRFADSELCPVRFVPLISDTQP